MNNEVQSRPVKNAVDRRCVELVTKYQQGDKEAFEDISRHLYPGFFYNVFKTVRDEYEAEDIVQEIFLKISQNLYSLKDTGSFRKWSYTIANSVISDYLQSKRLNSTGRMFLGLDSELEHMKDREEASEAVLQEVEKKTAVLEAVESLPEELKRLVMYRYYNNLPEEEVADIMGISRATLRRRMETAKSKLKRKLHGVYSVAPFLFYRLHSARESRRIMEAKGVRTALGAARNAAAAGGIAAGVTAAVILRAPVINQVRFYDQGQYVNGQRVEWTVESALPLKSVRLADSPYRVSGENGSYSVEIPVNGTFRILAENSAGMKSEKIIHISNIDSEAPVYAGYEENGEMMILRFSDALSGINWDKAEFTADNGKKAGIGAIDTAKGEVLLRKDEFPMQAQVEDYAGNYGVYSLNLRAMKPGQTAGGKNNAE